MQIKNLLVEKLNDHHNRAPVNIAFLGDSVTQGCFETFSDGEKLVGGLRDYEAVYHNLLRRKIQTIMQVPVNMINAAMTEAVRLRLWIGWKGMCFLQVLL